MNRLVLSMLAALVSLSCAEVLAQSPHPALLPAPVSVRYGEGWLNLQELCVAAPHSHTPEDAFAVDTLLQAAHGALSACGSRSGPQIRLQQNGPTAALALPGEKPGPQSREAYKISIAKTGVRIEGRSSAGVYYGVQTLLQMIERGPGQGLRLPLAEVEDWPALSYRATLMDAGSEGPMLTFDEVEHQIDFVAKWKGNQYFFYSEANIELRGYPLLNPDARFTQEQIRRIVAYGRARHIDVIPAIEMYGHLHDLFRIEKYSPLADAPNGGQFDADNPRVKAVLADWAAQMAELFPSPFVDIGFDETWSLQKAADHTASSTPVDLFLRQLNTVASLFQAKGKTVMAYADIMVKFPGIVSRLPRNLITLPWYYDPSPDPEYHHWLDPLVAAHLPLMVTSGVTSWDQIAPDFTLSFENIDTLLAAGRKAHSLGLLNTLWTDNGQMLMQMSWPGIAYGAAAAWQQTPLDRGSFFSDYARIQYPPAIAADVAAALTSLNAAERSLQDALGPETMRDFWRNPFTPGSLQALAQKGESLRQARLHAEDALTHLYAIRQTAPDTPHLDSFLFGAETIDLAGMKFLDANQIASAWLSLPPHPTREQFLNAVGEGVSNETHSRMMDMMDGVTETERLYRKAWLQQYTPYRLGTAAGHWEAEYLFWLRAQANFENFRRRFQSGEALPTLEQLTSPGY